MEKVRLLVMGFAGSWFLAGVLIGVGGWLTAPGFVLAVLGIVCAELAWRRLGRVEVALWAWEEIARKRAERG